MDAVAPGLGADIDDGIADAGGLRVEDLVATDEAEGKSVHQRVTVVAGLELYLAAEVGYSEAIAVAGDSADYAFENGVVAVDGGGVGFAVGGDGAEAEGVHDGEGTRAHSEDVSQDAADAGGRTLEGLDELG